MRIGWLVDEHDPPGGAELTQAEFWAAAPAEVELVDCPPGDVVEGLDRYVVHNCTTYSAPDLVGDGPWIRYHHDLRGMVDGWDRNIFCGPAQRDLLAGASSDPIIPPAMDLTRFWSPESNGNRKGAICVGAMLNPGKGGVLTAEWAQTHGGLDFAGHGAYAPPESAYVAHLGPVAQDKLPELLWRYETFVYLPTVLEPFGRCVVEAWAAGCQIVTNKLVGARYWINEAPEKLETAAEDFWSCVLDS